MKGTVAARTIYGTVRSLNDNNYIGLASIAEVGAKNTIYTNDRGIFFIRLNVNQPVKLICSYNGFESDTIIVDEKTTYLNFRLKQNFVVMTEVVVAGSRKNERKFESPATIETLDPKQIQYSPSMSIYDRMANVAGVDAITTSLNYKVFNTRGFNSAYNRRFIQRFDNMELAMPGFSTAAVQLNGPVDLDIEKIEFIAGAASALYGPNALNGLANITSKNPFQYKGISAQFKSGINHIDNIAAPASSIYDLSLRYANTIGKELAYKIVMSYMTGTDWHATNYADAAEYNTCYNNNSTKGYGYKPGMGNPGYDAVNKGGDEVYSNFDSSYRFSGPTNFGNIKYPIKIARTGYKEEDMFNYKIYSLKTEGGIYYRPSHHTEISWLSRVGSGTANFQTENRSQILDFVMQMHKLEVKHYNHVFRTYGSFENSGTSYDFSTTAIQINNMAKDNKDWFDQYLLVYTGQFNNLNNLFGLGYDSIKAGDDATARKFADADNTKLAKQYDTTAHYPYLTKSMQGGARFEPGTKAFDSVLNYVTTHSDYEKGSKFQSRSKILYSEYIYDFKDIIKSFSLLVGANYRLYAPHTRGTLLADTGALKIYSNEVGAFIQFGKDFYSKRLKLQASTRVDKLERFDARVSPRASVVVILGKKRQHTIRLSAQLGYRMPTLYDQFNNINIQQLGVINFGGFYQTVVDMFLIKHKSNGTEFVNMYTQASVNKYILTGDSTILIKPQIKDIKPEEIRAFEIGWRSFTFKKIETDATFYINRYQNLIATQQYVGLAPQYLKNNNIHPYQLRTPSLTAVYRRSGNSEVPVSTYGVSISANYYYSKKITLFGNYSFNKMNETQTYLDQDYISQYNTPQNKFNLGITTIKLYKSLGFSTIYRWVQSYDYLEFGKRGTVPAYYTLDLAFSYQLSKKYNTLLKLGGTNITNLRYVQSIGGPTVGAVFYFSILYDELLK
ncbi:MAG: TonB-dependent receptor plug domain-containing protein [Bacteroidota bacterium]|nr:TonB-dependent receptor plug domain-containing protein [Bacteroidota bacterium]